MSGPSFDDPEDLGPSEPPPRIPQIIYPVINVFGGGINNGAMDGYPFEAPRTRRATSKSEQYSYSTQGSLDKARAGAQAVRLLSSVGGHTEAPAEEGVADEWAALQAAQYHPALAEPVVRSHVVQQGVPNGVAGNAPDIQYRPKGTVYGMARNL